MSEIRKSKIWSGQHRGISFEVKCLLKEAESWREKDAWTFYVYLSPDRLPEESIDWKKHLWLKPQKDDKGRIHYNYMNGRLAGLNWHCGITYYSKEFGLDGDVKIIKAGCDYQHYWDEGHNYSESILIYDAKQCIDSFLERVPNYKRFCGTVGGFWLPSEGVVSEDGQDFISQKGIQWHEEKYPDGNGWWKKQAHALAKEVLSSLETEGEK